MNSIALCDVENKFSSAAGSLYVSIKITRLIVITVFILVYIINFTIVKPNDVLHVAFSVSHLGAQFCCSCKATSTEPSSFLHPSARKNNTSTSEELVDSTMNAYQSIKKIHHAASTPGVVASGTATPGGIIHHPQKGLSLYDDESSSVFERNFKISEIINPDGSVSIRRKIINPDGSSCIREEEYCDLKKISSKTSEVPNLQLSDSSDSSFSSLATVKTKGSSAIFRTNPREEMQQRSFVDARSTQSDSSDSSDISYLLSSNAKDMMKSVQIEEHPRNRVDTMSSQSDEDRSSSNANEIFKTYQRGKQQRRNRVGNQWAQADSSDSSNISYLHSSDKSSTFKPTAGTTHLKKTSELHTQQWLTGDDGNFGRNEWPFCTTRPMNPVPFEDVKRSSPKPSVSKRASSASLSGNSNAANSHSIDGYSTMSFSSNAQEKPRTRPKLRIDRPLLRAPNVEKPVWQSSDTVAVTVKKEGAKDKIGINVGLKDLACGVRLVVSKISPNGKFANSPIEMGDIVVSINGKKFLENPNPEDALGEYASCIVIRIRFPLQPHSDLPCATCHISNCT